MRRPSMLLLCAVAFAACANASPYSKIADNYEGQVFGAKVSAHSSANSQASYGAKSSASSSASSSAYSSSNANAAANAVANAAANDDDDGYILQNPGTGFLSLESSGRQPHQQLQAPHGFGSSSSAIPHGFTSGNSGSKSGSHSGAGQTQEGGQYWWMGAESPFGPNGKPSIGCGSNGCSASGTFNANQGSGVAHAANEEGQVQVQVHQNPFLGGNAGSFSAGSSYNKGSQHSGSSGSGSGSGQTIDFSKNPFFSGGVASGSGSHQSGSGASATSSASASAQASAHANAAATANAAANANANAAAQNTGNSYPGYGHDQTHQVPQQTVDQAQYPQEQYPQIPEQETDFGGYPDEAPLEKFPGSGGITVSCSGKGKICVAKHLCNNGYVSSSVQGLTQIRSGEQNCDVNREVCCNMPVQKSPDQSPAGSASGTSGVVSYPHHGGIFDNDDQHQETDLNGGDQLEQQPETNNGYLPPINPDASGNNPSFVKIPEEPKEPDYSPSGPAPTHVQLGCAAALICVEEQLCGMDGFIRSTPIILTSEQLLRRMPLSDCKNPDNGVIGKCCRDPNYVDPWPAGNLPANYSGGFDHQGFPNTLNFQKQNLPTKKPTIRPSVIENRPPVVIDSRPPPIKGRPPVKGFTVPQQSFNEQKQFPSYSEIQNQIGGAFDNFFKPPQNPSPAPQPGLPVADAPVVGQAPNRPSFPNFSNFPNFPNFPTLPNQSGQKNYESSPSDQNPVAFPPHTPGSQCGVKNTVQRPSGLNDGEVGFGEIPWQAMILNNGKKSLLCSGAFVAPNAVVTAASCVDGYQAGDISVKAGEWKLGYELKHEEPLPFEIVQVDAIAMHPGYLSGYSAHDIAMLILKHPVALDQHVDTICLGRQEAPKPGSHCISTGWGKSILETHAAGAIMRAIDVDVMSQQECEQRLREAEGPVNLDETLICAKAHRQNNNMCQVDFGGPLACDRGDGYYEIMGVYTQDTGCLPTNQVATFALIDDTWVQHTLANPPVGAPSEPQRRVEVEKPLTHQKEEPCDCQKSNLPPQNNQYLPPV